MYDKSVLHIKKPVLFFFLLFPGFLISSGICWHPILVFRRLNTEIRVLIRILIGDVGIGRLSLIVGGRPGTGVRCVLIGGCALVFRIYIRVIAKGHILLRVGGLAGPV